MKRKGLQRNLKKGGPRAGAKVRAAIKKGGPRAGAKVRAAIKKGGPRAGEKKWIAAVMVIACVGLSGIYFNAVRTAEPADRGQAAQPADKSANRGQAAQPADKSADRGQAAQPAEKSADRGQAAQPAEKATAERSLLRKEKRSDERRVLLCMGEVPSTMYITWSGDESGPEFLRCSKDKYSLPVTEPIRAGRVNLLKKERFRYEVTLEGLEPGRTYYYEIGDGTVYDSPRFFTVPAEDGEDVFAFLGDPQMTYGTQDYDRWGDMVQGMYARRQDIETVIIGGDMINLPGATVQWDCFLDNCRLFDTVPVMTVPGNHEGVTSNYTYRRMFNHVDNGPAGEAFYYFDMQNCRFIMLDSSFLTKARQAAMGQALWTARKREIDRWIENTLEGSDKRWNIVVVHHPIYGLHDLFTTSKTMREEWLPIMKEGGVDLVLSGHQHVYMRSRQIDGITYVMGVSGSRKSKYYRGSNEPVYSKSIYASGPNYQVFKATDDSLEIMSYNEKGSIIDAAHIDKGISLPYFQISW